MLVSDFDYHLPPELIAQAPLADRAASRLLCLDRSSGRWEDLRFRDLPSRLRPGDLLVLNDTRVFPARLFARRAGLHAQPVSQRNPAAREFLHGRIEVLLTRLVAAPQIGPFGNHGSGHDFSRADSAANGAGASAPAQTWQALVRPGRKIGVGEKLFFGEHDELQAEVIARGDCGERTLRFAPVEDFFGLLDRLGHVPLPPYIARADREADRDRYQTVYARARGSVAAPTAGLHFTPAVLEQIRERGIETAHITLHVGLGTFQPVRAERVEDHRLHTESYSISAGAAQQMSRALDQKRRVVAVGTTTVRTLEFVARENGGRIVAGDGEADIFIYPGFDFRITGALLTNFHLPQSTLLMLVCAFAGRDRTLAAYGHAVRQRYRFYSYGDCMFIA